MLKNQRNKPEWAVAIEFPGGHLPGFVYDKHGLPCGFAFFTTQHHADVFLRYRKNTKGTVFKFGADHSLTEYQSWAVKCVQTMLHQMGKELNIEEVSGIVYTQMPVFVDVKTPHLSKDPEFPSLFHFIQEHFTTQQCKEVIADAEFIEFHYLTKGGDEFTLAKYSKGGKFMGICKIGTVEHDHEVGYKHFLDPSQHWMATQNDKLGKTIYVTMLHETEAGVVAEAEGWIRNRKN